MFEDKSRYKNLDTVERTDRRGRTVAAVTVPPAPDEAIRGYHLRIQGQRVDHMAHRYLSDPAGFWRICEANDAMLPDALAEASDIAIPRK